MIHKNCDHSQFWRQLLPKAFRVTKYTFHRVVLYWQSLSEVITQDRSALLPWKPHLQGLQSIIKALLYFKWCNYVRYMKTPLKGYQLLPRSVQKCSKQDGQNEYRIKRGCSTCWRMLPFQSICIITFTHCLEENHRLAWQAVRAWLHGSLAYCLSALHQVGIGLTAPKHSSISKSPQIEMNAINSYHTQN